MKWISLEEEIPEFKECIILKEDGYVEIAKFGYDRDFPERKATTLYLYRFGCPPAIKITHWMDLPKITKKLKIKEYKFFQPRDFSWIDVEKYKPDSTDEIFGINNDCPEFGIFKLSYLGKGIFCYGNKEMCIPVKITHWLRLTNPIKEEVEDE